MCNWIFQISASIKYETEVLIKTIWTTYLPQTIALLCMCKDFEKQLSIDTSAMNSVQSLYNVVPGDPEKSDPTKSVTEN